MHCCIPTPTIDSTGMIWVTLNILSAAKECCKLSLNYKRISHFLESGHPVISIDTIDKVTGIENSMGIWSSMLEVGRYGPVWHIALLQPTWNHTATSFWQLPYIETVSLPPNAFSGLRISHTCICGPLGEIPVFRRPPSWSGAEEGEWEVEGREWEGWPAEGDHSAPRTS